MSFVCFLLAIVLTYFLTFSASDYQFGTPKHLLHVYIECKEFLKILKMWPETVNRWRTDKHNGQKKANNDQESATQKTKDWAKHNPTKNWGWIQLWPILRINSFQSQFVFTMTINRCKHFKHFINKHKCSAPKPSALDIYTPGYLNLICSIRMTCSDSL